MASSDAEPDELVEIPADAASNGGSPGHVVVAHFRAEAFPTSEQAAAAVRIALTDMAKALGVNEPAVTFKPRSNEPARRQLHRVLMGIASDARYGDVNDPEPNSWERTADRVVAAIVNNLTSDEAAHWLATTQDRERT